MIDSEKIKKALDAMDNADLQKNITLLQAKNIWK